MKKSIYIPKWYENNRIRSLRTRHKMNQTAVSEKIGCVLKTYQNYEQGRNFPTLEYATRLSDLYGVSIDYLLGKSQYTSIDNEKIGELIGLSNQSIDTLKKINNLPHTDDDIKILNYIMSDVGEFSLFLNILKNYIKPGYTIPIHPVRDSKTQNTTYIPNLDIESDSILSSKERCVYLGKPSGKFNNKPTYDIVGIPISSLSSVYMLRIQELLQLWKKNYKEGSD